MIPFNGFWKIDTMSTSCVFCSDNIICKKNTLRKFNDILKRIYSVNNNYEDMNFCSSCVHLISEVFHFVNLPRIVGASSTCTFCGDYPCEGNVFRRDMPNYLECYFKISHYMHKSYTRVCPKCTFNAKNWYTFYNIIKDKFTNNGNGDKRHIFSHLKTAKEILLSKRKKVSSDMDQRILNEIPYVLIERTKGMLEKAETNCNINVKSLRSQKRNASVVLQHESDKKQTKRKKVNEKARHSVAKLPRTRSKKNFEHDEIKELSEINGNTSNMPLTCFRCNENFTTKSKLKLHMLKHEKPGTPIVTIQNRSVNKRQTVSFADCSHIINKWIDKTLSEDIINLLNEGDKPHKISAENTDMQTLNALNLANSEEESTLNSSGRNIVEVSDDANVTITEPSAEEEILEMGTIEQTTDEMDVVEPENTITFENGLESNSDKELDAIDKTVDSNSEILTKVNNSFELNSNNLLTDNESHEEADKWSMHAEVAETNSCGDSNMDEAAQSDTNEDEEITSRAETDEKQDCATSDDENYVVSKENELGQTIENGNNEDSTEDVIHLSDTIEESDKSDDDINECTESMKVVERNEKITVETHEALHSSTVKKVHIYEHYSLRMESNLTSSTGNVLECDKEICDVDMPNMSMDFERMLLSSTSVEDAANDLKKRCITLSDDESNEMEMVEEERQGRESPVTPIISTDVEVQNSLLNNVHADDDNDESADSTDYEESIEKIQEMINN